mmetsp:Transcript_2421/g.8124  ORF Transcript_2421/g.8124 Transcript_2421/m.8124 type:complete len:547 (+) Transcript_2421:71-1711(+)
MGNNEEELVTLIFGKHSRRIISLFDPTGPLSLFLSFLPTAALSSLVGLLLLGLLLFCGSRPRARTLARRGAALASGGVVDKLEAPRWRCRRRRRLGGGGEGGGEVAEGGHPPLALALAFGGGRRDGRFEVGRRESVIAVDEVGSSVLWIDVEEGVDVGVGAKVLEILEGLADADELDGDLEVLDDAHAEAGSRGAVELGDDEARDADVVPPGPRLVDGVATDGGVDDEQRLVGGAVELLRDGLFDLVQFHRQRVVVREPPRGVDDDDVVVPGEGDVHRLEGRRRRRRHLAAGTFVDGEEVDLRAVGPHSKLVDGRGPEGVARREEDGLVRLDAQPPRELPDRRCLPHAVRPHHHDHRRFFFSSFFSVVGGGVVVVVVVLGAPPPLERQRRRRIRQHLDHAPAEDRLEVLGRHGALLLGDAPHVVQDRLGRRVADVSPQQPVLQLRQRLLQRRRVAAERRGDRREQRVPAHLEAGGEPREGFLVLALPSLDELPEGVRLLLQKVEDHRRRSLGSPRPRRQPPEPRRQAPGPAEPRRAPREQHGGDEC